MLLRPESSALTGSCLHKGTVLQRSGPLLSLAIGKRRKPDPGVDRYDELGAVFFSDCIEDDDGCERLWETAEQFSKPLVDACVHRGVSVHSPRRGRSPVVRLRYGRRRTRR